MIGWIRVSREIGSDPKLYRLAHATSIDVDAAIGKVVRLFAAMVEHADDGDLSPFPPALIETWANWRGTPGDFDREFRALFCQSGRVVRWDDYNGKAVRRAKSEAERKREYRERKREEREAARDAARARRTSAAASAGRPQDGAQDVPPPVRGMSRVDETGRDETENRDSATATTAADAGEAKRESAPPTPETRDDVDADRAATVRDVAVRLTVAANRGTFAGLGREIPNVLHAGHAAAVKLARELLDAGHDVDVAATVVHDRAAEYAATNDRRVGSLGYFREAIRDEMARRDAHAAALAAGPIAPLTADRGATGTDTPAGGRTGGTGHPRGRTAHGGGNDIARAGQMLAFLNRHGLLHMTVGGGVEYRAKMDRAASDPAVTDATAFRAMLAAVKPWRLTGDTRTNTFALRDKLAGIDAAGVDLTRAATEAA